MSKKKFQLKGSHDNLIFGLSLSPADTIKRQKDTQIHVIGYSDPEGDLNVLQQSRTRGHSLVRAAVQNNPKRKHKTVHLSLGDMVDKGPDDLSVLRDFKDGAGDDPRISIAGNRDKNKIRFLQELLNTDHLANLLQRNQPPHWDPNPGNQPQTFLLDMLIGNKEHHGGFIEQLQRAYDAVAGDRDDFNTVVEQLRQAQELVKQAAATDKANSSEETRGQLKEAKEQLAQSKQKFIENNMPVLLKAYSKLDVNWQRVFAAHWMLEKTMGCPHKFALRKANLHKWSSLTEGAATDIDVVTSFIEEMLTKEEAASLREAQILPETPVLDDNHVGLMREYLENSCELVVIGNTIFSHGALTTDSILKHHDGNPFRDQGANEDAREYMLAWVNMYNQEYRDMLRTEIQRVIHPKTHSVTNIDLSQGVGCDAFNLSGLPTGTMNRHTTTTGNHFNQAEPDVKLNATTAAILREAGLIFKSHGHQPSGFCGTAVEKHGITDISADAGISKFDPSSHQSRDGSENTYVVIDALSDSPRHQLAGKANTSQGGFNFETHIGGEESFVGCFLELDGQTFRVSGYDKNTNQYFLLHRDFKFGNSGVAQADAGDTAPKRLEPAALQKKIFEQAQRLDKFQLAKYLPLASADELVTIAQNEDLDTEQTTTIRQFLRVKLDLACKAVDKVISDSAGSYQQSTKVDELKQKSTEAKAYDENADISEMAQTLQSITELAMQRRVVKVFKSRGGDSRSTVGQPLTNSYSAKTSTAGHLVSLGVFKPAQLQSMLGETRTENNEGFRFKPRH